jgi:hypothetical protein
MVIIALLLFHTKRASLKLAQKSMYGCCFLLSMIKTYDWCGNI